MLNKIPRQMSPAEFYAWQEPMDEKYELVDGFPAKMMTGANRRHDQIVVNVISEFGAQLRGGPCRGFTSDTAIRTGKNTRRRADAGVECGTRDDASYEAGEVCVVVEVLSPSTREFDLFGKLDEYKSVASMEYVLFIEPNAPQAIFWLRRADVGWTHAEYQGLDAAIEIASLGVRLALGEIYAGLNFRNVPKPVEGDAS